MGSSVMPVYLLDGPEPVLFDAGLSAYAQVYIDGIREILRNRSPRYLFLTHTHFDHVGAAGYFKRFWPDLKIIASALSRDILARPGVVRIITDLNKEIVGHAVAPGEPPLADIAFESFNIDQVIAPDQCFSAGPETVIQALFTPGHTRDFTSYWIATNKILVASEAVGCENGQGYFQTEFLVDYDNYISNIQRLSMLNADVLCPGHVLVLTGEDVEKHLHRALTNARNYLSMVEGLLRETAGDIHSVVAKVKATEWDNCPWPKQIEQAYLLNTRQRVQTIWERMQFP